MSSNPILSYLFTAEYRDGTALEQTPDDVSSVDPKRSQFFDVLEGHSVPPLRELVRFSLSGEGHSYSVDLRDGTFRKDGEVLPVEGAAFVKADEEPYQLIFYRLHQHHRITPAIFINPRHSRTLENGYLEVTDSEGAIHTYPEVSQIHQIPQRNEETGEERVVYEVWPKVNDHDMYYLLGWQTNDVTGRKQERTITFA